MTKENIRSIFQSPTSFGFRVVLLIVFNQYPV